MALSARIELRQGQQLVMTPQLQQAIRLLQLSNVELSAFVEAELERNPLLERDETDGQVEPERTIDTHAAADTTTTAPEMAPAVAELDLATPSSVADAALDVDREAIDPEASGSDLEGPKIDWSQAGSASRPLGDDDDYNLEQFATADVSLRDHLAAQLNVAIADPIDRIIAQYLIDAVDDAGYLTADLVAAADDLGASQPRVEAVLARLQTFDPAGVMARSLAECLALQLADKNRLDPLMQALLDNLPLLAQRNLAALRRAVDCDMDELVDMIDELKQLDPKPGLRFGAASMQVVVPDVLVRAASNGAWIVELNSETLPRVLVNRTYYARVTKTVSAVGDKDYMLDCLQTANWLIKSLDQRARTILRVSQEIVRQQDAFFMYGVQHLRPLNLKAIAEAVSMHESTISRVTSNKYMATPRGIFELKYFFTSAIQSSEDGEAHSSEAVRHRIKVLIDQESPAAVLSDDMIVARLKSDGVDIARRTVAKYREALRIPSSVQRRREKATHERAQRVG